MNHIMQQNYSVITLCPHMGAVDKLQPQCQVGLVIHPLLQGVTTQWIWQALTIPRPFRLLYFVPTLLIFMLFCLSSTSFLSLFFIFPHSHSTFSIAVLNGTCFLYFPGIDFDFVMECYLTKCFNNNCNITLFLIWNFCTLKHRW